MIENRRIWMLFIGLGCALAQPVHSRQSFFAHDAARDQLLKTGHQLVQERPIAVSRCKQSLSGKPVRFVEGLCSVYRVLGEKRFGTSSWMLPCDDEYRLRILCELHSLQSSESPLPELWKQCKDDLFNPSIAPYFDFKVRDSAAKGGNAANLVLYDNLQFTHKIDIQVGKFIDRDCLTQGREGLANCIAEMGLPGISDLSSFRIDDKLRIVPMLHYLGYLSLDNNGNTTNENHVAWSELLSRVRSEAGFQDSLRPAELESWLKRQMQGKRSRALSRDSGKSIRKSFGRPSDPTEVDILDFFCLVGKKDHPDVSKWTRPTSSTMDKRAWRFFPDRSGCPDGNVSQWVPEAKTCRDIGNHWSNFSEWVKYPWGMGVDIFAPDSVAIDAEWESVYPWLKSKGVDIENM